MPMHRPSSSLSLSMTGLRTTRPIVREPQTPQLSTEPQALQLGIGKQIYRREIATKGKGGCNEEDSMLSRRAARVYGNGPQQIMPYLFLGGEQNANEEELEKQGITRVLNVAREVSTRVEVEQHMHMPWDHNETNVAAYFDSCFEFIDEGRKRHEGVLVHCQLGVSRSASLVIAYVMRTMHEGFRRAYEYVQLRAPCISPNLALISQLCEYGEQMDRGLVITTQVTETTSLGVPELTSASSENSSTDGSVDCPCPVRAPILPLVTTKPLADASLSSGSSMVNASGSQRIAHRHLLLPIDQ
ncbi:tyrosine/serine/threonine protein phosphatase [Coemansia brasiliensis]|uniref:protein-tyrosine-phosphatase n=1 Tax=Coemansia brasiliensis TaxID=2650707 RepID=A0A9W8I8I9_9FUNG|nr:tyrosine/serine/threonine protein phosphatase [Coemansia brasiliensis]